MRVLHIQKTNGIGGCERQLLDVLPALARRDVELGMCVLGAGRFQRFVDPLRRLGIPTLVIPAGPHVNPLLVPAIARQVRRFRPDLVHTHLIHGDVYGQVAARVAGVPAVSSIHSTHDFYLQQPYRSGARLAGHLARRTIAISYHVADFLRQADLVPPGRVRVVHYGVEASEWVVSAKAAREARSRLGFGPDDVVVGIASRLIADKGHTLLIDAVAGAGTEASSLRLAVAGDGPMEGELKSHAATRLRPEQFRFLGFLPDIREFMAACDIVVFPTLPALGEGFGLVALEAMAAGRPVLATSVGSLREVVADGETGFLVDPRDPADLSARLVSLASNRSLRERLGAAGRDRAYREFGVEKSAGGILSVYEEAA